MHTYLVEFIGTLFLTFVVLATGNWLSIGAALAIAYLLGGPVSGAAYNPAIALAYLASGKITNTDIIPYIIAEVAGALIAYELIKLISYK